MPPDVTVNDPVKGAWQFVLSTMLEDANGIVVVLSITVYVALAEHPKLLSVTTTS